MSWTGSPFVWNHFVSRVKPEPVAKINRQVVSDYLQEGLSIIPTKEKVPVIPVEVDPHRRWGRFNDAPPTSKEADILFKDAGELGVVCGRVSGNLEVIDVDCKYDLTGRLWVDYWQTIKDNLPEVWKSLVVAETRSKGYHILYRCETIGGSRKLANRPPSAEELSVNPQEERLVLIETKGQGGYIIAEPSEGYRFIQGGIASIPTITAEQRRLLLDIAQSFDEMPELDRAIEVVEYKRKEQRTGGYKPSTFEDFNERGDVVSMLKEHGWKVVYTIGDRVFLKRPGQTTSKFSANYHKGFRRLTSFSTSTDFNETVLRDGEEIRKPYTNVDVFAVLKYGELWRNRLGDVARELHSLGYGDQEFGKPDNKPHNSAKKEPQAMEETERSRPSKLKIRSYNELKDEAKNTPDSLRTGYKTLDKFVGISYSTVTLVGGRPGEGKTTFMFNLLLSMAREYPDKKFYFFSYEEPASHLVLKMLNSVINKPLNAHYKKLASMEGSEESNYNFLRHYLKDGNLMVDEVERGDKELNVLMESNVFLLDSLYSVDELAEVIREIKALGDAGAVFIDYAQRIPSGIKSDGMRERYIHISETLKNTAKETGLPLVVGAQVNRKATENEPELEHLKESGNFEEDANTVFLLMKGEQNTIKVKVPKNRDGVRLSEWKTLDFIGETGRILDKGNGNATPSGLLL